MAHVFPRKLNQNDQPIEAETINENLQRVAQEISGRLNEHNVRGHETVSSARFVQESTEVDSGAILNVYRNGWIVEILGLGNGGGYLTNTGVNDPGPPAASDHDGGVKISVNSDWVKVDNMSVTIRTANATLWAMASLQHICVNQHNLVSSIPTPVDEDKFNGIQYAIAVDGSVLHDSILGGLDRVNDPFGEAWNGFIHGFVADTIIPVTPGTHEVALYARFCPPHDFETTAFTTAGTFMVICNRELIVVEMK